MVLYDTTVAKFGFSDILPTWLWENEDSITGVTGHTLKISKYYPIMIIKTANTHWVLCYFARHHNPMKRHHFHISAFGVPKQFTSLTLLWANEVHTWIPKTSECDLMWEIGLCRCHVIYITTLRWDHSGLSQDDLNPMTGVFTRHTQKRGKAGWPRK